MGYDPAIGRFLEMDPDTYVDGPNEYQLEESNPIGNVDSTGLATETSTLATTQPTNQPTTQPTSQPVDPNQKAEQLIEAQIEALQKSLASARDSLDQASKVEQVLAQPRTALNGEKTTPSPLLGMQEMTCSKIAGEIEAMEQELADLQAILKQLQPPPAPLPPGKPLSSKQYAKLYHLMHPTTQPTTQHIQ